MHIVGPYHRQKNQLWVKNFEKDSRRFHCSLTAVIKRIDSEIHAKSILQGVFYIFKDHKV